MYLRVYNGHSTQPLGPHQRKRIERFRVRRHRDHLGEGSEVVPHRQLTPMFVGQWREVSPTPKYSHIVMSVPWSENRDVLGEVGGNVALADQGHDLRILQ